MLGVGAFGAVIKATNSRKEEVAIKVVSCLSDKEIVNCFREASLMRKVSSVFVGKLIEYFYDKET